MRSKLALLTPVVKAVAGAIGRFVTNTPRSPLETAIHIHLNGLLNTLMQHFAKRSVNPMGAAA